MHSVVEFPTREDMDYALRKLDGRELGGEIIRMFEEPGAAAGAGPAAAPPPRREFRRRSYSPGPARSRSPGPRERMPYRRDDSPRDHHRPHYGRRDDSPPPRERYGRRDDSPPPPPREDGPLPPVGPRGDESPRGRDAGYDRRDDSPPRRGDSLPPRSSSPRDHRESSWDNQPPPGDAAPGVIESEGASSDH
ncbi:hypothetical protein BJ684DRAFT_15459 [Piptocephalis cylindrospora]|uniref:RRM domain-containing protein n=1 Tax=Piptocephalis cylindrospora TaxID=1907219 RepID=A0A4P9Y5B0_9FUNG|nr:hypothetical protein BJ684DRAFT_15459 [Piptocephalis cylindrospora]|eukprot:RKP14198.1 hypothetical protein BJ684DRAFT_15459 [Piptocephalis cylindrospora]